jgi:eukaryotic-like serine/threonine-protein kinase
VYRARDTRLDRDVAIKVLPDAVARDGARLARFEREAQLLAALNHPNISAIYGIEEQNELRFLVLEYVPGETLAEKLGRGAIPLEETLVICLQLAEALEAAHEKGIVHRDLKPANLIVTPEGKVKVLDFGLAKDVATATGAAGGTAITGSPTLTSPGQNTQLGVIMGTAAYMSPEQARGKAVDKRADIWAFGCVLYEMLTGRRPFGGETVTDVLAAIVRSEPDWTALPPRIPVRLGLLLRRCLQKEPRQRLHDMGDARLEIDDAMRAAPEPATAAPVRSGWKQAVPWAVSVILAAAAVGSVWTSGRRPSTSAPRTTRSAVTLPPKTNFVLGRGAALAFSPDGARVAYVAAPAGGASRLYLRALDRMESTLLPDTEGATDPFFSPDSKWVAFFADHKLKKVSVLGGAPFVLCDVANPRRQRVGFG